jgi:hypothetical protein
LTNLLRLARCRARRIRRTPVLITSYRTRFRRASGATTITVTKRSPGARLLELLGADGVLPHQLEETPDGSSPAARAAVVMFPSLAARYPQIGERSNSVPRSLFVPQEGTQRRRGSLRGMGGRLALGAEPADSKRLRGGPEASDLDRVSEEVKRHLIMKYKGHIGTHRKDLALCEPLRPLCLNVLLNPVKAGYQRGARLLCPSQADIVDSPAFVLP